ncbi:hypothetical protein GOV13_02010 [Candidatus Pacearchaeota archaeon]|nr:hypothetical protein [Candidatus Pacearchaeota archaeon]
MQGYSVTLYFDAATLISEKRSMDFYKFLTERGALLSCEQVKGNNKAARIKINTPQGSNTYYTIPQQSEDKWSKLETALEKIKEFQSAHRKNSD